MSGRKRLAISIGALLVIYWIGVGGYLILDRDLSVLEAIYMVTITISTVGYREVVEDSPAIEAWTIMVILFGTLGLAVAIASVAGLLVEGQIGRALGSRKLESRIKQLNQHTIVCGFGHMGRLLVERLSQKDIPLVVIERDPERLRELEKTNRLHLVGDATEEWVLEAAGVGRAKSLVAALASDADNLFVTLTARQMHPDVYIVARAENPTTHAKLRRAGANRVISPQTIGADWIANVLTRPHVVDFVDMASRGGELEMAQVEIGPGSWLAGKSLRDADLRKHSDVIVVAIRRPDGTTRFNPGADEIVQPGDLLITIGQAGAACQVSQLRSAEPLTE